MDSNKNKSVNEFFKELPTYVETKDIMLCDPEGLSLTRAAAEASEKHGTKDVLPKINKKKCL